ncbi:proline-, glutamic acid- and leucine-rich protein 1-like [Monodelphis domestica]|uniref:proline-, glutamic acid- and leucine-rich protein 1-like n=1 Tax=Monodelphis domestica TaxID=13616 RepID=UPI0024E1DE96|nr:proline-, glutamic acid- and leucine-rich protein 1-like [Monodelphis domestica]
MEMEMEEEEVEEEEEMEKEEMEEAEEMEEMEEVNVSLGALPAPPSPASHQSDSMLQLIKQYSWKLSPLSEEGGRNMGTEERLRSLSNESLSS